MTPMGFKMLEINSQNLLRKNLKQLTSSGKWERYLPVAEKFFV
jgi:hypothetical protein